MTNSFSKRFQEIFEKDSAYIKSWLVAWDYQLKRNKRKIKYSDGLPSDFYAFNGATDLPKWMRWFMEKYTDYLPAELTKPLVDLSLENDKMIFQKLGLEFDFPLYHQNIGINNAHDYLLPTLYPVPERNRIKNVIDFGAGYGRQANLWTSKVSDGIFVGMDAIPNSYGLQNMYYSQLGKPLYDYIDNPSSFRIEASKKGIYHLPTWRYDLLPDNTFDLVMCVQVLPELNSRLVSTMMNEFHRVLKPGGMVYIRDHASIWKPAGKMDVGAYMADNGFVLEFQPHLVLDGDIHGIPRIWRKIDPAVKTSQMQTLEHKKKQLVEDIDTLTGGLVKSVFGKRKK